MNDPKQQLADLIEAYAAARCTGNQILIQAAATGLQQLLTSIDVTVHDRDTEADGSTVEEVVAA